MPVILPNGSKEYSFEQVVSTFITLDPRSGGCYSIIMRCVCLFVHELNLENCRSDLDFTLVGGLSVDQSCSKMIEIRIQIRLKIFYLIFHKYFVFVCTQKVTSQKTSIIRMYLTNILVYHFMIFLTLLFYPHHPNC